MIVSVAEYISLKISELNIKYIFGVPGSYIMPVWEEISKNNTIVLGCHESGAGFMAEGYSRATNGPSVLLTTSAPGVTNAVTAIANAYMDSIPLIIISGQVSTTDIGKGAFQECSDINRSFSQNKLLSSITKLQVEITSIENFQFLFENALITAQAGRPGPVHITIPINIQKQKFNYENKYFINNHNVNYHSNLTDLAKTVNESKRPLLYVGWGAYLSDASEEINQLSKKISAPIVTSLKGLSCIKSDNDFFVGHFGMGSDIETVKFIKNYNADLIVVLGSSLSIRTIMDNDNIFNHTNVISINIEDNFTILIKSETKIISNIKDFINDIIPFIISRNNNNLKEEILSLKQKVYLNKLSIIDNKKLNMSFAINLLNDYSNKNTVFIPDSGNHWLDCLSLLKLKSYGSIFLSMGLATMGYSFGAAIGYALAFPQKKIVLIGGDGSFLMSGNEIINAIRYHLNIVVIIINNKSLGRVRIGLKNDGYSDYSTTDIDNIDYHLIGKAMGFQSFIVNNISELKQAYNIAFSNSYPIFIQVNVNKDDVPVYLGGI